MGGVQRRYDKLELLHICRDQTHNEYVNFHYLIVHCLVWTRPGSDIDFVSRYISIIQTKTDKPRKIPLTARALEILRGLRQDAPEDERIFDHKRTGRRRRQLMVCFQQVVKSAGIDDFHSHDLRHTFATRLRAANVHEYDITDLPGHSTTKYDTRGTAITRGHAHGVPKRLRDAVDSLEEGKRIIIEGWEQEAGRTGCKSFCTPLSSKRVSDTNPIRVVPIRF